MRMIILAVLVISLFFFLFFYLLVGGLWLCGDIRPERKCGAGRFPWGRKFLYMPKLARASGDRPDNPESPNELRCN